MDDLFSASAKKKAGEAVKNSVPILIIIFTSAYTLIGGGDVSFAVSVNSGISAIIFSFLILFMYSSVYATHAKSAETKYSTKYNEQMEKYEAEREIAVKSDYLDIDKWLEKQMVQDLESRRRHIVSPYVRYDIYEERFLGKPDNEVKRAAKDLPKKYRKAILKANHLKPTKLTAEYLLSYNRKIGEDVRTAKQYKVKIAVTTSKTLIPKIAFAFVATSITVVVFANPEAAFIKLLMQLISLVSTAFSARSNADNRIDLETYLLTRKREMLEKYNGEKKA